MTDRDALRAALAEAHEGDPALAYAVLRTAVLAALDGPGDRSDPAVGLREAVAVVIHRWRHPTKSLEWHECHCYEDARLAVDIARDEGLIALAATPTALDRSDPAVGRYERDATDYGWDVVRSSDYKEGYDDAVRRYVRSDPE